MLDDCNVLVHIKKKSTKTQNGEQRKALSKRTKITKKSRLAGKYYFHVLDRRRRCLCWSSERPDKCQWSPLRKDKKLYSRMHVDRSTSNSAFFSTNRVNQRSRVETDLSSTCISMLRACRVALWTRVLTQQHALPLENCYRYLISSLQWCVYPCNDIILLYYCILL